jgi:hypothetical protein
MDQVILERPMPEPESQERNGAPAIPLAQLQAIIDSALDAVITMA